MTEVRISVHPIYGWGWHDPQVSSTTIETPTDFEVLARKIGIRELSGPVISEGHPYAGMEAHLTQMHVDWDGVVNVDLRSEQSGDDFVVNGFAEIPLESLQNV